jgi:hypothetical protein
MRSSLLQSPLANIKIIANGTKRKKKCYRAESAGAGDYLLRLAA